MWAFIKRHRRKFIGLGVVSAGALLDLFEVFGVVILVLTGLYGLYRYALWKLEQMRIQQQEAHAEQMRLARIT